MAATTLDMAMMRMVQMSGRAMMQQGKRFADVQRPGEEAKAGKEGSRREAAEDVEDEQGGDAMDGALNEEERRVAPDADADPEPGGAEDDAQGERDGPRNAAIGDGPGASGKERQPAREPGR